MLRAASARLRAAPKARAFSTSGVRASAAAPEPAELAFRRFGHLEAQLDPLGLAKRAARSELSTASADAETLGRLRETYAGRIGAEFEHLDSAEEREWFANQLESQVPEATGFQLSTAQKRNAARAMLQADTFEHFLGKKYVSLKRYSGEGTESLLPALDTIFAAAAADGVKDVVIGQAHRGRLAVLVSCLGYPARKLFNKINGNDDLPAAVQGLDDVSSHIAASCNKSYVDDHGATRSVHVSLVHNPSHLEAVNPVAIGKTRAKRDQGSEDAMCLLIHGDAAVYGQGVVAETYAASLLPGYAVGGTMHVVTNNQIGFTADERTSRSSAYASDLAKLVGAPVLHVNAESMREVVLACKIATAYRTRYGKDVVVDLIGYRRHGHNELDAAEFTQPAMYGAIHSRPAFAHSYASELAAEGVLTAEAREGLVKRLNDHLEAEFKAAKDFTPASGALGAGAGAVGSGTHVVADGTAFGGKWRAVRQGASDEMFASPATGVDVQVLREVGRASVTLPAGFAPHDRLVRGHVLPRLAALGYAADGNVDAAAESAALAGPTLDWATAEALAFGSLLAQGHDVRLSGQDAQRGTFSHRHAMFVDQRSGAKVNPLHEGVAAGAGSGAPRTAANNAAGPGRFSVVSSLLSEFGVLGFEYGYSWENPDPLVLWEAQFGDFSNGAQIIIDQFISGGESKWLRQSGLVMLLPHGYDGAGPEHSSARIERFLQLVNSQAVTRMAPAEYARMALEAGVSDKTIAEAHNMVVANPTTPANYFHLLRRQVGRPFRKPLVVVGPKTLLRHPAAKSALADLAPGTGFQPVLTEGAGGDGAAPAAGPNRDIKRVLLVSGKLHLELAARRAAASSATAKETAIVRVEELAPFPTAAIMATLQERYPALGRVDWVQEEPANAGAWTWAEAHMAPALQAAGLPALRYFGRPALAAPAVGLSKLNKLQQEALLKAALP